MKAPLRIILLCLATSCSTVHTLAQTFPERPLRIIVPQPAGGGYDMIARIFAEQMAPSLGQPVVVENRPGAGTVVGSVVASKAPADGYTMLIGGTSNMAMNIGLYPKLQYDPINDFEAVGTVIGWPYLLVASKSTPHAGIQEFLADARANPGKYNYASAGRGSGQHIAAAALEKFAGIRLTHVPYSGAAPAYNDVISGRVEIFFDSIASALPQVQGGNVKLLAVSTAQRDPAFPDAPSLREAGVPFDFVSWVGLFVPTGTPPAALQRLRAEVVRVRALPSVAERLKKTGGAVQTHTPGETGQFVKDEAGRWTDLIRGAGITIE